MLIVACGDSETTGTIGGSGGRGGIGGEAVAGTGGDGGTGALGGADGEGGAGGEPRAITSSLEWKASDLIYQAARCVCQGAEPMSESACLATGASFPPSERTRWSLPLSDRQNRCFDEFVLNEELMTLETRLECLVQANEDGAACLGAVEGCDASEIADCEMTTTAMKQACPTPFEDVAPLTAECSDTVVEDAVDAFLDAREAQCNCRTSCMNAERDPVTVACMEDTLELEMEAELGCFAQFWRTNAVCFGNETECDGAVTACSDLQLEPCEFIDETLLEACLAP